MTKEEEKGVMKRPFANFPSFWSNFFDQDLLQPFTEGFSNRGATVYEEKGQLHVEVPVPGLDPKDIEVSLNKGVLFVKGKKEEVEEDKKRKFYRSSSREYSYSIILPTQVNEKQEPQATCENGILKISWDLAAQNEAKKITVKAKNS
jgi:HSP20 family protein